VVVVASVYCVYRARNAAYVRALLAPVPAGWPVHLWALDEPVDALVEWTRGSGPGWKFDLVNGLLAAHPAPPGPVVVADDDVVFAPGTDLPGLVAWVERAGLDLAMPAHVRETNASYAFTLRRRLSRARLTPFVEIGPLFVVGERARDDVLPFPDGLEMGWGLEVRWAALAERGLRLGIVDAVPVAHAGTVSEDYDRAAAQAALDRRVADAGLASLKDLQRVHATWRPWQQRPPWT
jgi:hypothetical protein